MTTIKSPLRNKSSKMNATIRRIDLCGKLVAPFLFGLVFDAFHSPESKYASVCFL